MFARRRIGSGWSLGTDFRRLWGAYAVSTFGTWLAFDAFSLVAILVLHAGPAAVSLLAAIGLAAGALLAIPLGPWVEFRRKRPVMVGMDLIRFAAIVSIPVAYALGMLAFGQLLVVSVIVATADIGFKAASGATVKALVQRDELLTANARFESTMWTATALGPPVGGALVGAFGPVTTLILDAVSYVLSAVGIRSIRAREDQPARKESRRLQMRDLVEGWRFILAHAGLRPLFFNTVLVNGLIMATAPLIAVLMLGDLGFAPWQYGLAFGAPCVGGLIGSRLSRRAVARFGRGRVLLGAGTLRSCWSVGLAFIVPGAGGLVLVFLVQLGLVTSIGLFNPVFATYRLEQAGDERVARTLSAWSVTSNMTIALMTLTWGLLAALTSPRTAIAVAGVLMLTTPLLLLSRVVSLRTAGVAGGGAYPGRSPVGKTLSRCWNAACRRSNSRQRLGDLGQLAAEQADQAG